MRRIRLVLALGAVMVAMLIAFAGPAMADDWDHHHRFFAPVSRFDFCDDFDDFDFNCGFGFGRTAFVPFGFGFDIDQDIGDTGDVTIGLNVS